MKHIKTRRNNVPKNIIYGMLLLSGFVTFFTASDINKVIHAAPRVKSTPTPTKAPTSSPIPTVTPTITSTPTPTPTAAKYQYVRLTNPARTTVNDMNGNWLATFSDNSYTVTIKGPSRTFSERTAPYSVTHTTWVRVLSQPFKGIVDESWLDNALVDTSPDILQRATDYIENAPNVYNASGLKIAGDADYGPLQPDGTRKEGSDFNDFLGVSWTYEDGSVDVNEAEQINSLDCSGFLRMIWGYRSGLSLSINPNGTAIPRRSFEIYNSAPGVVIVSNSGAQVTNYSSLSIGDIVFFDASTDDGTQIDHIGTYIGKDTNNNYRFISSRKSINGPTLGDYNGKSILNGTGLYAKTFRAIRRF